MPNVTFFAKDYAAPRSLRSNLNWNGPILNNRFTATIEGTYSRNMNQPGIVDLNFSPTVQFTLPDESHRPVFVQPTSIVPATGTIASSDARVSPLFSRVTELQLRSRSDSRQLSFRFSPTSFSTQLQLGSRHTSTRICASGFAASATPPAIRSTSNGRDRAFDSRHQIQYNLGYNFFDAVRVNWFGSFRSGTPYTPLVAGDINGDGYANDRAFVYDPASTADPALAASMQSLLNSATGNARDCLCRTARQPRGAQQLSGSVDVAGDHVDLVQSAQVPDAPACDAVAAGRQSARAPPICCCTATTTFADGAVRISRSDPARGARLRSRHAALSVRRQRTIRLDTAGTDCCESACHCNCNDAFRPRTDARAAGAHTATRSRQHFARQQGAGADAQGHLRTAAEFQIRWRRFSAKRIRSSSPAPRRTASRRMNRRYVIRLDSIWSPVAKYLAALPDNYDKDEAYSRYRRAREDVGGHAMRSWRPT